jgi:hypothetical protein
VQCRTTQSHSKQSCESSLGQAEKAERRIMRGETGRCAMDDDAAKQLVTLQNKIAALESVLKKRDPPLYKAYLRRLKDLESEEQDNSGTFVVLPKGLHKKAILDAPEE